MRHLHERCSTPEHINPRPGQEWVRRVRHNVHTRASRRVRFTTLHVRIVAWEYEGLLPLERGQVETRQPGGEWGRRRSVRLSAFSNTPSGYTLLEDACVWDHPGCLVKHPMGPEELKRAPRR
jgi:hypothetical protein